MSRWLKNVNALLENLDNQVEETVEEHRFNREISAEVAKGAEGGDEEGAVAELLQQEAQGIDDILAKRGLLDDEEDMVINAAGGGGGGDDDEGGDDSNAGRELVADAPSENAEGVTSDDVDKKPTSEQEEEGDGAIRKESILSEEINFDAESAANNDDKEGTEQKQDLFVDADGNATPNEESKDEQPSTKETAPTSGNESKIPEDNEKESAPEKTNKAPSSSNLNAPPRSGNQMAAATNKSGNAATNVASLKELRKLRRHVLQLNSDLESTEREIEAQRAELDRAASRMERDRSRHKQEKESTEASHKAEVAALAAAHERAIQQLKESNDSALQEMEARVTRAEQQRAQEGGERDIELASALDRERASLASSVRLQEEKTTMNERITTLNTEVSRLVTRLENATSQMELASERELNAEEQLDKALSLHARQLGVRQRRESELEQTVADLGGALVVAKTKVEAAMKAGVNLDGNNTGTPGEGEEDVFDLKARLQDSQDEIETLRAQLSLERQRCSMLHNELQDLSKEQADELSGAHAKQRQYERKISDLTSTVAKLQSSLRRGAPGAIGDDEDSTCDDEEYTGLQHSGDDKKETDHLRKQISSLSEKIFGMQTKIDTGRSEISTLKNRVRSAALRSETAEKSLEAANQRLIMADASLASGMSSADEEMGLVGRKKRRPRSGFRKTSKVGSIRSALGLHPGRFPTGGWQEMTASLLDTFDGLAIDLGSHFRHYPVSRLAFLMYLLILHLWAFFLLVYHAHHVTGDVDAHGPEAMFNSYRHVEQVPRVAAMAAVKSP